MKRLLLATILALGLAVPTLAEQVPPRWNFQGRYLIAISDADMLASAYENGQLGPIYGSDKLSVIPLDTAPQDYNAFDVDASNSVAGPPSVVDVTPDGRYAYVVETFSPRPGESAQETFADFTLGTKLTVIDLLNPKEPQQVKTIDIPERPLSVSVNHDGTLLAVSFHQEGGGQETPLVIYLIDGSDVTQVATPSIPEWDFSHELNDVVWHPADNILAMITSTDASVRFMQISRDGRSAELWGNVVSVGKKAFIGKFTGDGEHLIVNNLFWGTDVNNHWTEAPASTIVNIKLNHFEQDGQPVHAMTSQVMTRSASEGFAISPDGRYVAAVNMERSWLPYNDARRTWFSSISLIERDPETGQMHLEHTTPYYSVLPEMAVFDASGEYLAVVNYDQFDHTEAGGSIDFFKLVEDPLNKEPKMLVQTRYSVPVQHGAHDIVLVE